MNFGVARPVYPWGTDGPAFISCPEALQHGTVPSGSEFLHVGDAAVAGWKQWHVAAAAAHRNLGRSARELGSHGHPQVAKGKGQRGQWFPTWKPKGAPGGFYRIGYAVLSH